MVKQTYNTTDLYTMLCAVIIIMYNPKDTIKDQLISIISERCEKAPYVDVANAVDDIFKLPFENISEIMIKWMAENQHPHTMAEIDSTRAILWEGKQAHNNDGFLVD